MIHSQVRFKGHCLLQKKKNEGSKNRKKDTNETKE